MRSLLFSYSLEKVPSNNFYLIDKEQRFFLCNICTLAMDKYEL